MGQSKLLARYAYTIVQGRRLLWSASDQTLRVAIMEAVSRFSEPLCGLWVSRSSEFSLQKYWFNQDLNSISLKHPSSDDEQRRDLFCKVQDFS
jgi:hypothetical protein